MAYRIARSPKPSDGGRHARSGDGGAHAGDRALTWGSAAGGASASHGTHLKIIDREMKHSPPARSPNPSARTRPDREIAPDMIHALRSAKGAGARGREHAVTPDRLLSTASNLGLSC
ncbi:hypothetical protein Mame01_07180 [Microbispora amethystogenes]|nr:hypothetical protein Mame01_07180 [Microbispora amethystogenes]